MEEIPMKCIKYKPTGDIYRVADQLAAAKMASHPDIWAYCCKKEWKDSLKPAPSVAEAPTSTSRPSRSERKKDRRRANK
jgi:hypothetical protein